MIPYGKWRCSNAQCEMRKKGLTYVTDKPSYALVKCEKCGALMSYVSAIHYRFVGDYDFPDHLISAGALSIGAPYSADHRNACITTINDPDLGMYPDLSKAVKDPTLFRADLYKYLKTATIFLASYEECGRAVVVTRCPSYHLSTPLSHIPSAAIHIEAHDVGGYLVFVVLPLLWDNPVKPFYCESTFVPYDHIGISKPDLSHPPGHLDWRKLYYLLTQTSTLIILIDENNKVVGVRSIVPSDHQRHQFAGLLSQLRSCIGQSIRSRESLEVRQEYTHSVKLEDVETRFPPRPRDPDAIQALADSVAGEPRIVACPSCGKKNRLAVRQEIGTYRCGACSEILQMSALKKEKQPQHVRPNDLRTYPLFETFIEGLSPKERTEVREMMSPIVGHTEILALYDSETLFTDGIHFVENLLSAFRPQAGRLPGYAVIYVRFRWTESTTCEFVLDAFRTSCHTLMVYDTYGMRTVSRTEK